MRERSPVDTKQRSRRAAVMAYTTVMWVGAALANRDVIDQDTVGGSVARSAFAAAVVAREPVKILAAMTYDTKYVYFFLDLKGMTGRRLVQRWHQAGVMAKEEAIEVGGPRWRAWSGALIDPASCQPVIVEVRDHKRTVLTATLAPPVQCEAATKAPS